MKRVGIKQGFFVAVAAVMLVALAACSSQQSSTESSSSSASSSSASASSSSTAVAGNGDVVSIGLEYNAGTGYEWKCTADPEGVVTLLGQATENLAEGENISGGPLCERFTFQAAKPGEVVLTFDLVRSWEGEPAETQVYAFTVSDDLKMSLNPYKSKCDSEPEWETSS